MSEFLFPAATRLRETVTSFSPFPNLPLPELPLRILNEPIAKATFFPPSLRMMERQ